MEHAFRAFGGQHTWNSSRISFDVLEGLYITPVNHVIDLTMNKRIMFESTRTAVDELFWVRGAPLAVIHTGISYGLGLRGRARVSSTHGEKYKNVGHPPLDSRKKNGVKNKTPNRSARPLHSHRHKHLTKR